MFELRRLSEGKMSKKSGKREKKAFETQYCSDKMVLTAWVFPKSKCLPTGSTEAGIVAYMMREEVSDFDNVGFLGT